MKILSISVVFLAAVSLPEVNTGFGGINWNTVLLAAIGLAGTIYAARAGSIARIAEARSAEVKEVVGKAVDTIAQQSKVVTEVKDTVLEQGVVLKGVSVEVNSKTSAMVKKIDELTIQVKDLTEEKATVDERLRGRDLKDAATSVHLPASAPLLSQEQVDQIVQALKAKT